MIAVRASVLVLIVALCMTGTSTPQQMTKLRVGASAIDIGGVVYYALDLGYFKRAGLDVELTRSANGPATAAAVVGGTLDAGSGNALTLAEAHARGLPFVFIAPGGAYTSASPTAGMVAAKSSTDRTPKDFNNKTIAVATLGSLGEIAARAWLDQGGADLKTVKFVEMPYSSMASAIAGGRVAAAVMEEPTLDSTLAGDTRLVAPIYDAISHDFSEGGSFTTIEYARAHPDVIRRFYAAVAAACKWANANQAASAKILEKYSGVPAATMVHRVHYHETLDAANLQPLVDAAAKYGPMKSTFPATELIAPGL